VSALPVLSTSVSAGAKYTALASLATVKRSADAIDGLTVMTSQSPNK
jgi:hypothetical protein